MIFNSFLKKNKNILIYVVPGLNRYGTYSILHMVNITYVIFVVRMYNIKMYRKL